MAPGFDSAGGLAVVETDKGVAGSTGWSRCNQAGADEDLVPAECVVVPCDAAAERFIGDSVVQTVGHAAIPGHVKTWRW